MTDDHPLTLELDSLRTDLDKYQAGHAAHVSALHLQRARLEASDAVAHSRSLEAENARLKEETTFLRTNPQPNNTHRQVTELSLALRRISDKLSLTETTLQKKTAELIEVTSENKKIQLQIEAAYAEVGRMQQARDEARSEERELQRKCKAAEEEARMADTVVMEYADLVRSLDNKLPRISTSGDDCIQTVSTDKLEPSLRPADQSPSNYDADSSAKKRSQNLIHSLAENRFSLQRLLHEFNSETSSLYAEISRLHLELSMVQKKLDAEHEVSQLDRAKLTETLVEIERYKTDDKTAGKIVSRYMRFSQSSIDMLQSALSTQKARQAASLATLSSSCEALTRTLALERKRALQLRDILDQLTEDISRETFGRRREISLRLRSVVREEKVHQILTAWLRRAEEHRANMIALTGNSPHTTESIPGPLELAASLDRMIDDARRLIILLSHETEFTGELPESTTLSRIILVEQRCRSLVLELQKETENRLLITRRMTDNLMASPLSTYCPTAADPAENSNNATMRHMDTDDVPLGLVRQNQNPDSPVTTLSKPTVGDTPSVEIYQATTTSVPQASAKMASSSFLDEYPHEVADNASHFDDNQVIPRTLLQQLEEPVREGETSVEVLPSTSSPHNREPTFQRYHLEGLTNAPHRYDQLQRAFRDCHLALAQLKDVVISDSSSHSGITMVQNVIHRLDDFCEDAQVELEIRMADEERIAQSFQTMLSVPGALAQDKEDKARDELQLFKDGTAPSVLKTQESFSSKLADLEHDIAQVKRVFHDIEAAAEARPQTAKAPAVWSSWTSPFISNSPTRPSSPAPTFGAVITTPRSRRISSTSLFSPSPTTPNESTFTRDDPYAHLELRIPMPHMSSRHPSARLRERRSTSGMYFLGLGSSSGFFTKQDSIAENIGRESGIDEHHRDRDVE
ncbi:hypothetical protein K439DRAFT_1346937 [Ramaria rubella]|nr:hypothetical protein K439DRAFT_1346937 [Ramaria rubella]